MAYPKIWFLRHGQTEWNRAYRLQGQLDSPLTDQGIAEARRQATLMKPVLALAPDVFVSPLGRTRQTADIALAGTPYLIDDRLKEIHAGLWQGCYRDDLGTSYPDLFADNPTALQIYAAAEEGEGLASVHARVHSFLSDLKAPAVVVAHGLLGQVLRAEVCGIPMSRAGHLPNAQGCIYVLENGQETVLETED